MLCSSLKFSTLHLTLYFYETNSFIEFWSQAHLLLVIKQGRSVLAFPRLYGPPTSMVILTRLSMDQDEIKHIWAQSWGKPEWIHLLASSLLYPRLTGFKLAKDPFLSPFTRGSHFHSVSQLVSQKSICSHFSFSPELDFHSISENSLA